MPVEILQPTVIDTHLRAIFPDTVLGGQTDIVVVNNPPGHVLLKFDLSPLNNPLGATVVGATLSMYLWSTVGGRTFWVNRMTRIDWVESEATWNDYKSGVPWTTAGGDYTGENSTSSVVPSPNNWQDWSVGALVQDMIDIFGVEAYFLIKDGNETGLGTGTSYWAREYSGDLSLRPKLLIDYIPGPPIDYEWIKYAGQPTVEKWDITPEFRTSVTEFGSGKLVRNSKWSDRRRRFKIKYRTPMRDSDVEEIKDFYIARKGNFESFDMWVTPLGATHSVIFADGKQNFPYFMSTLAELGEVEFREVINEA